MRHSGRWNGSILRALLVGASLAGCAEESPVVDLGVANINLLHGAFCPEETDYCRLADRVQLLMQWIAHIGCPDVVTLQEVWEDAHALIDQQRGTVCPFAYEVVYRPTLGYDEELVLSRYPVLDVAQVTLAAEFRHALAVRVDHPTLPVDVVTTHLATEGEGAALPCDASHCPDACLQAGTATRRDCQFFQVVELARARRRADGLSVVTGDLNAPPTSAGYRRLLDEGYVDTFLEAGNAECSATALDGCTSGRESQDLSDLEDPTARETERIDYVFLHRSEAHSGCTLDPEADADQDGKTTAGFADRPNPFAASCGPAPLPICWPSDHTGVQMDLDCPGDS